jgi:hypothetical protein
VTIMIVAGFINVCVTETETERDGGSCSNSLWNSLGVRPLFYQVNYNIYYDVHLSVRQHSDWAGQNSST